MGDFERLILRARRHYARAGYSRLWIDQRMRSVTARHELTGEWYRRGFEALLLDARDAGRIIAAARRAIEAQSGAAVVSASNHLPPPPRAAPLPRTNIAA